MVLASMRRRTKILPAGMTFAAKGELAYQGEQGSFGAFL